MQLEKIIGSEVIYRYILNPEETRSFAEDERLKCWSVIEVYPDSQNADSFYFEGEEEPTIREIANIRDWKEEDYDRVVLWIHQVGELKDL